jgi:hypothetical protein
METQTVGFIFGVLQVLNSLGDLAVMGAALVVAILCTRRRFGTAAGWVLFAAATLAFGAGLFTRLMYMYYSYLYDALGQAGSFVVELTFEGLEMLAVVLMGVAILLFRPMSTPHMAGRGVSHD